MSIVGKLTTNTYSNFSPLSLPRCALWLDGKDNSTITLSGSGVTQWNDKSGSNNHAIQLTSLNQPTFSNGAVFNGSNSYLQISNPALRPANVYIVGSVANSNASNVFQWILTKGYSDGGSTVPWEFMSYISTQAVVSDKRLLPNTEWSSSAGGGGGSGYSTIENYNFNDTFVMYSGWDSSQTSVTIGSGNGILSTAQNVKFGEQTIQTTGATDLRIGTKFTANSNTSIGVNFFNGTINEILIYTEFHSSNDRQQIEGYLAWKWNVITKFSSNFPYKSIKPYTRLFQPTDVCGCALWLDSADAATITTIPSTSITQWNDKSGNARHATGIGTTSYLSNSVNGKFGMYFDVSSFFYGSLPYTSNTLSSFIVGTVEATSQTFGRLLGFSRYYNLDSNNIERLNCFSRFAGTTEICSIRNNVDVGRNMNIAYATPFQCGLILNNTSSFSYINGTDASGFTNASTTGNFAFDMYSIGSGQFGLPPQLQHRGFIFETITYTSVLTQSNRQQIEGYLAWKWNIVSRLPAGHPYKDVSISIVPSDISGCALWLDAGDTNTITTSTKNRVTQWNDKSGTGNTALQTAITYRPIYSNSEIIFDGYQSHLSIGNNPNIRPRTNIFSVVRRNDTLSNALRTIIRKGHITGNAEFYQYLVTLGTDTIPNVLNRNAAGVQSTAQYTVDICTNKPFLMTSYWDGVTHQCRYNGNLGSCNVLTGTQNIPAAGLDIRIGASFNGNSNIALPIDIWDGAICEILCYSNNPTISQREEIEAYLSKKWKIQPRLSTASTIVTPTDISGISLWLDAADYSSFTLSSNNVLQWRDKSGLSNHASNIGILPYMTNPFTNRPSVYFDASAYANGALSNPGNSFSAFAVVNMTKNTAIWGRILAFGGPGGGDQATFHAIPFENAAGSTNIRAERNSVGTPQLSNWSFGNLAICGCVYDGSGFLLSLNGSNTSVTTTGSGNFAYTRYGLGKDPGSGTLGAKFGGYISEVIVYNNTITSNNRYRIEQYLMDKWGLTNLTLANSFKDKPLRNQSFLNPLVVSNCILWLDGKDPSTLVLSGSNVVAWLDKSGSNNHCEQTTAGNRPLYLTNTVNFTKTSSQFMDMSATSLATALSNKTYSIFLVGQQLDVSCVWFGGSYPSNTIGSNLTFGTSTANNGLLIGSELSITSRNTRGNGSNTIPYSPNDQLSIYSGHTFATASSGTGITNIYRDSVMVVNSNLTADVSTWPGAALGRYLSTVYSSMNISEILFYNRRVSEVERMMVEGYLANKWNIKSMRLQNSNYSPLSSSNCTLWLDASDRTTIDLSGSTTTVTQWRDKSGSNNHSTSITGTVSYFSNNPHNGKPSIYFNNSWLRGSNSNTTNKLTAFAVVSLDSNTAYNYGRILSFGTPTTNDYGVITNIVLLYRPAAVNGLTVKAERFGGLGSLGTLTFPSYNTFGLLTASTNGISIYQSLNGTPNIAGHSNGASFSNFGYTAYGIGKDPGTAPNHSPGHVSEVLVYNSALTYAERVQIEAYLIKKWNIPSVSSNAYATIKP